VPGTLEQLVAPHGFISGKSSRPWDISCQFTLKKKTCADFGGFFFIGVDSALNENRKGPQAVAQIIAEVH